MKKVGEFVLIGVLVLVAIAVFVSAAVNKGDSWHSSSDILISVKGYSMTLQEAINNDFLVDGGPSPTRSYTTGARDPGHSNVWVSVNGHEMTLHEAITTSNLCGYYNAPYHTSVDTLHYASEIEVSVDGTTMSLQDAINGRKFCNPCVPNKGASCGSTCAKGTVACDGSCSGITNLPMGTSCGGNMVCDGVGNCNVHSYTVNAGVSSILGTTIVGYYDVWNIGGISPTTYKGHKIASASFWYYDPANDPFNTNPTKERSFYFFLEGSGINQNYFNKIVTEDHTFYPASAEFSSYDTAAVWMWKYSTAGGVLMDDWDSKGNKKMFVYQ